MLSISILAVDWLNILTGYDAVSSCSERNAETALVLLSLSRTVQRQFHQIAYITDNPTRPDTDRYERLMDIHMFTMTSPYRKHSTRIFVLLKS